MRPSLVPIVASLAIIAMWEIARPAAVDQCRARRLVADRTIGYWDMRARCALEQSGSRHTRFGFFAGERETHASNRRRVVVVVETAHVQRRLAVIASHL